MRVRGHFVSVLVVLVGSGCFESSFGGDAAIACSGDADCLEGRVCQPDVRRCLPPEVASAPPPSVAGLGVSPAVIATGTVTLTFTSERASSADIEVDGVRVGGAVVDDGSGSGSVDVDDLAEGAHTVVVRVVDAFGRTRDSNAASFVVDRTAPTVVALNAPTLVRRGDALVLRAALDGPVADGVTLRFGEASVALDGENDGVLVGSVIAELEGGFALVLDGVRDAAGNAAGALTLGTVAVDGTPPVIDVVPAVELLSRVEGRNVLAVDVSQDGSVVGLPEVTLGGRSLSCDVAEAGVRFRCTRVIGAGDVEGVVPVLALARDSAGNVGFASSAVQLDFTPPTPTLQQLRYDGAGFGAIGASGSAEVTFVFDEPVVFAEATLAGLNFFVELGSVARVTLTDPAGQSGTFPLRIRAADAAGNDAINTLTEIVIDVDAPADPRVDVDGEFVLVRSPFGELAEPGARARVFVGSPPPPGERFLFSAFPGGEILGSASTAGGANLSVGDLDEVYVSVVDGGGNFNPGGSRLVREGLYHVTMAGKRAGSVVPNPHSLFVRRDDRGRRAQDDDVEVGAEDFADGVAARLDAAWRRVGLGTGLASCAESVAFDPRVGRVIGDECVWEEERARFEARGTRLGLTAESLVYVPKRGAVFLVGGQQLIGDNPNTAVFERRGDNWVSAAAIGIECFAGAGVWDPVHDEAVIACEGDVTLHGPIDALRPHFGAGPQTFRGGDAVAAVAGIGGAVSVDGAHTWDWDGAQWRSSPRPVGRGVLATHPETGAPLWLTSGDVQERGNDGVWRALLGTAPPARVQLGRFAVTDATAGRVYVHDGGAGMWQWSPSPSRWRLLRGQSLSPGIVSDLGSFAGGAVTTAGGTSLFVDDGWRSLGHSAPEPLSFGGGVLMDLGGRLVGVDGGGNASLLEPSGWRALAPLVDGVTPGPLLSAGFDGFFFTGVGQQLWAPTLSATSEGDPTPRIFWESFGPPTFTMTETLRGTRGAFLVDGARVVRDGNRVNETAGLPTAGYAFAASSDGELIALGEFSGDTYALAADASEWRPLAVPEAPGALPADARRLVHTDDGPLLLNTDIDGTVWQLDRSVSAALIVVVDLNALRGFALGSFVLFARTNDIAAVSVFDTCTDRGFVDVAQNGILSSFDLRCAIDDSGLAVFRLAALPSSTVAPSQLAINDLSFDVQYVRE